MIIGKMEAIEKRFKFYQKSIFFSDLNIEQQQGVKNRLNRNLKLEQTATQMNMAKFQEQPVKPPKTTPSIGNNTITFYSPKVLNRPVTVNPTPLVDPKSQYIENAKHFKTETYLSRLLKAEKSKKFEHKVILGKNPSTENQLIDQHNKPIHAFENIKIKQHIFK